jgi:hypothetical protein
VKGHKYKRSSGPGRASAIAGYAQAQITAKPTHPTGFFFYTSHRLEAVTRSDLCRSSPSSRGVLAAAAAAVAVTGERREQDRRGAAGVRAAAAACCCCCKGRWSSELFSQISSHPAVFFSHSKPANSTFNHNKPAKRTGSCLATIGTK